MLGVVHANPLQMQTIPEPCSALPVLIRRGVQQGSGSPASSYPRVIGSQCRVSFPADPQTSSKGTSEH